MVCWRARPERMDNGSVTHKGRAGVLWFRRVVRTKSQSVPRQDRLPRIRGRFSSSASRLLSGELKIRLTGPDAGLGAMLCILRQKVA